MTNQTKQDLIDILKAIQPYGFRESCLTDEELLHLLIDLADHLGIPADDYIIEAERTLDYTPEVSA